MAAGFGARKHGVHLPTRAGCAWRAFDAPRCACHSAPLQASRARQRQAQQRGGEARPAHHARQVLGIRLTLLATERLVWQCGAHTAEPESAPGGRFLITKICVFFFLWHMDPFVSRSVQRALLTRTIGHAITVLSALKSSLLATTGGKGARNPSTPAVRAGHEGQR